MEVNQERVPAPPAYGLAAYGLAALRSGVDPTSGPLFLDCLQPAKSPPAAPPAKTSPSGPRASDVEPPKRELEARGSTLQSQEERDDEPESDETNAAPQVVPTEQAPQAGNADAEAAVELTASVEEAAATSEAAEEPHSAASVEAVSPVSANGEVRPIVCPIAPNQEPLAKEQADEAEQANNATPTLADKQKQRGKTHPQDAASHSEEPAAGKADKAVAKGTIPVPQAPESSESLHSSELAALESQSDDANSSTADRKAIAAAVEAASPPPAAELAAPAPAAESPAATNPATSHSAAGVDAATLKPPALLLKAKAGSADVSQPAGEIDPAKFLSRVAKAFESAHQRGGEVRLRLHPVELGALSIEVRIHDSVLTASVQAETPEAKAAIIDNLPALRERLADQGIRIDKFDVDLMDHSDRRQQSLDEQTRQQEARQAAAPRPSSRRAVSAEPAPISNPRHRASGQDGLNVVI